MPPEIRRAEVDLTSGSVRVEGFGPRTLMEHLGGIGRSLPWFWQNTGRTPDPFAPEAPLFVNIGVFTGSKLMTGLRTYFTAYSPLKRSTADEPGIVYSAASGNLGQEIAFTGLSDLILRGSCDRPSYLLIEGSGDDLRIELRDAAEIWGLNLNPAVAWLKGRHPEAHFAAIGPAGANRVRYACVGCSTDRQTKKGGKFMRFAGRGGIGAVLGSKNLAAIAVRGTDRRQRDFRKDLIQPLNKEIAKGDGTSKYRDWGTWRYNVEALGGPDGGIPIHNFREANHPDVLRFTAEGVERTHHVTDENCVQCGIKCWKIVNTKAGEPLAKVDYEPFDLLGPNLGIFDLDQVADLIMTCDELGFDAITLGGVLGYCMENGLEGLSFGDYEGARRLMDDVAHGRNEFAALGVKRMGELIGRPDNAIHVHGMELAAYLGNTDPASAFALAGNHMTMATYALAGNKGLRTVDQWVDAVPKAGLGTLLNDMSGACKFGKVGEGSQAALLTDLGVPCTAADLQQASVEVYRVGRRIDARQGFTPADDTLPARCFERRPGQGIPQFNTPEFFAEFKARLYDRLADPIGAG